ncbi:MAG: hypothetical protein MUO41_12345 [Methyloceanibacter sp.]|nr:hypothetical protein [Methyloceanibacter sp.]
MHAMSRALVSAAALAVLLVGTLAAQAAEGSSTAQAQCRTAEVNPVTGHVLCIDPLGAAVETPPLDAMSPCALLKHDGDFTYAPNCKDKPTG